MTNVSPVSIDIPSYICEETPIPEKPWFEDNDFSIELKDGKLKVQHYFENKMYDCILTEENIDDPVLDINSLHKLFTKVLIYEVDGSHYSIKRRHTSCEIDISYSYPYVHIDYFLKLINIDFRFDR